MTFAKINQKRAELPNFDYLTQMSYFCEILLVKISTELQAHKNSILALAIVITSVTVAGKAEFLIKGDGRNVVMLNFQKKFPNALPLKFRQKSFKELCRYPSAPAFSVCNDIADIGFIQNGFCADIRYDDAVKFCNKAHLIAVCDETLYGFALPGMLDRSLFQSHYRLNVGDRSLPYYKISHSS